MTSGPGELPDVVIGLHAITLLAAGPESSVPRGDDDEVLAAVRREGFGVVQQFRDWPSREAAERHGLGIIGSARITEPDDVDAAVGRWSDDGCRAGIVHLGDAIDDDARADQYCRAVIEAQHRHDLAVAVETHRATITQDLWRTVRLAQRHPELRFNLDFSHWYVAGELTYGDYDERIRFVDPVFDRTDMLHARVADPGCIQTPLTRHDDRSFVDHFRSVWTTVIDRFRGREQHPQSFLAIVELVPSIAHYARTQLGQPARELVDRWDQALITRDLVAECVMPTRNTQTTHTTQGERP